jgi:hypothetical protein
VTGLAERLGERTQAGDAILLTPPELAGPFVSHYGGPAKIYLAPAADRELAELAAKHRRIFLVEGDPEAGKVHLAARDWLTKHGFWAAHEWADSLQVLTYGTVAEQPAASPVGEIRAVADDMLEFVGYDLPEESLHPGDIVPLTLFWQRLETIPEDYGVFVHLVGGDGLLAAQNDSAPVAGSRPTSGWRAGEIIVDRRGVLLPSELAAGEYLLLVGMYLPATGERLQWLDSGGQALGDAISVTELTVTNP